MSGGRRPTDATLARLKDAMQAAKENNTEVPAPLQALATKFSLVTSSSSCDMICLKFER